MKAQRTNWGTEDTFKYEICKEKYYIPIHFHQFAELVLMLDGEMKVTVNGRTEMLRTGQFTFVFPYQAHSFQAEREVFLVIYTFSPSLLTDFFRCFKISLGLNFCTLLACIRVEYAKTLLTKTAKSMLEIGLESGFGSERSFHRQFKNITGTTPGEYRTQRSVQVTMHRDDEHEQYLFPDTLDVYRETRKKQQA